MSCADCAIDCQTCRHAAQFTLSQVFRTVSQYALCTKGAETTAMVFNLAFDSSIGSTPDMAAFLVRFGASTRVGQKIAEPGRFTDAYQVFAQMDSTPLYAVSSSTCVQTVKNPAQKPLVSTRESTVTTAGRMVIPVASFDGTSPADRSTPATPLQKVAGWTALTKCAYVFSGIFIRDVDNTADTKVEKVDESAVSMASTRLIEHDIRHGVHMPGKPAVPRAARYACQLGEHDARATYLPMTAPIDRHDASSLTSHAHQRKIADMPRNPPCTPEADVTASKNAGATSTETLKPTAGQEISNASVRTSSPVCRASMKKASCRV
ncbi:hypothetical protein ACIRRA_37385 [Nocardia sp. NPDC101769]|uniref:hypothetical protein n=1 Tax=Nocardia sp. NPDC101769 TaxID=3364333 RepID=UPI003825CE59